MSDPFAHHPPEDLEASTSITTVDQDAMDHAAGEAARLVKAAVSGKSGRPGRKGKTPIAKTYLEGAEPAMSDAENHVRFAAPETEAEAPLLSMEADLVSDDVAQPVEPSMEMEMATAPSTTVGEGMPEVPESMGEAPATACDTMEPPADAGLAMVEGVAEEPQTVAAPAIEMAEAAVETPAEIMEAPAGPAKIVIEPALSPDPDAMQEFRAKFAQTIHSNIESSISFWTSLLQVKSPSDVLELNTTHLRRQMETFLSQSLELSVLARKAATVSMTSLTGPFDRFRG